MKPRRAIAREPSALTAELDELVTAVAKCFALLSEPTRLKILNTICGNEQSLSAIVEATGATQTNVSRHLALLHQAGVVRRRKERNAACYKVAGPVFADVCRAVCVQVAGRIDARQPLREGPLEFAQQY